MKILMLSWEYPPKSVGGLAEHVCFLSRKLAGLGDEIHVITCEAENTPYECCDNGVCVHRVIPVGIHSDDFIKWVMHLNFAMLEKAIDLITGNGKFDIIHAHDWLSLYSAMVLKKSFAIPMVCTIHSTENGRNNGIRTEMQKYISSAEWTLTYEAWKVVACGHYMRQEIHRLFGVPWEKIWVIPNGVDSQVFGFEFDRSAFRRRYATDSEKLVFFIGRHVYEKGIQILAEASARILREYGGAKFVIAGAGPMTSEIKNRICGMGMQDKFFFTGYVDTDTKNKLYMVADVTVVPSLYEPFGIVALEAMAAGCPVVVSDTGGLGELVRHGENGLKIPVGSPDSLADNIIRLLRDKGFSESIKNNAQRTVCENYTWDKAAAITRNMYKMVKDEESSILRHNS